MRLNGTIFVVALAAMTPALQAQAPPDANERNRQPPGAPQQRQPRGTPRQPEPREPFANPNPFGDLRFGRNGTPSAPPKVVCGTTIVQANPDADRRMLKPAPEGRHAMRRVRPDVCVD